MRHANGSEPQLDLLPISSHVNVGWLVAFVGKEENTIWTDAEDCGHAGQRAARQQISVIDTLWRKSKPCAASKMAGCVALCGLVPCSVRQRERSRQHRHFRGNGGKIIHETIGNR